MADAVTSQVLYDGPDAAVIKCTNISDGTGESAVVKVDVSALDPAPSEVVIQRIDYASAGMSVNLLWDATADVVAWVLPAGQHGSFDFSAYEGGGISNNAGTGKTGDLVATTVGHTSGDTY